MAARRKATNRGAVTQPQAASGVVVASELVRLHAMRADAQAWLADIEQRITAMEATLSQSRVQEEGTRDAHARLL